MVTIGDGLLIMGVTLLLFVFLNLQKSATPEGESYQLFRNDSLILTREFGSFDTTYRFGDHKFRILATDSTVRITESHCRAQICVKTGPVSKAGHEVICLPYKVVLRVTGERGDGADFIAR